MFTVAVDQGRTVVFLKVTDTSPFIGMPNAIIEPDLAALRGVHPHKIKIVSGRIIPKTEAELPSSISIPFQYHGIGKTVISRDRIRDWRVVGALVVLIFTLFGLSVYLK
jgi:hypothetical protein